MSKDNLYRLPDFLKGTTEGLQFFQLPVFLHSATGAVVDADPNPQSVVDNTTQLQVGNEVCEDKVTKYATAAREHRAALPWKFPSGLRGTDNVL